MGLLQMGGEGAPEAPPADGRTIPEGEANVTPEEQAEYEMFVENGLRLIYAEGGKVQPGILEALRAAPEKKQEGTQDGEDEQGQKPQILALANAAVQIVSRLDDSSREAGKPISDDVLMHGGIAIIEELAEVAEAAKIYDFTEDDLEGALVLAVDMYRPKAVQDGRTTEDTLKGQFNEVVEADKAGKLGDILPGVEGQAQRARPPVRVEE